MGGRWSGSMVSALASALAHPEWWALALAAFLVRGGFLLILLPIVPLPSPAAIATAVAPTVNAIAFGGLTLELAIFGVGLAFAGAVAVTWAGFAGAWLDLALLREAKDDEELELRWSTDAATPRRALWLRLAAHVPTLLALAYGSVRLVFVAYDELLSPGDASTPLVLRLLAQAPDVVLVVVLAWLYGETAGGLAFRHVAAGLTPGAALRLAARQAVGRRSLQTVALTIAVLAAVLTPFILGVAQALDVLRFALADASSAIQMSATLLVMVAAWILGLLVLGAALAWRATAWTLEAAPSNEPTSAPEAPPTSAPEAATG